MSQGSTALVLTNGADGRQLHVRPQMVVLAGYTGRNRTAVQRHIDELAAEGIAPPPHVPMQYTGRPDLIQVGGSLPAGIGWCSGELEYVLLVADGTVYVGVGSDHTDREVERTSVDASKIAFPKIVSGTVWPLTALLPTWDSLVLRSWVTDGQARRVYQEGPVATLMAPPDLLQLVAPGGAGEGLVVYSGTVPIVERAPASGRCDFEGQLVRPSGEVLATCTYDYMAAPEVAP
jgi:hypothetical protein